MQNLRSLWNMEVSWDPMFPTWHSLLAQYSSICHATFPKWRPFLLKTFKTIRYGVRYNPLKWYISILTMFLCSRIIQNKGCLTHNSWALFKIFWEMPKREATFSRYALMQCEFLYFSGNSWFYNALLFVLYLRICGLCCHLRYLTFINLHSRMFSQETLVPRMTKQSRHWCGYFCPGLKSFFLPRLSNR